MSTQWNDAEDAALDYLPHVDQVIYLRGIRRRMNYQTGIAGGPESPISYAWLGQLTDVQPEIGSHLRPPKRMTLSALRASFARLERAGLITRVANNDRRLVFDCLLASKGQSVSGRNGRGTAEERQTRSGNDFVSEINDLGSMSDRGTADAAPAMNGTIQVSGLQDVRVVNTTVEPALGGPDPSVSFPAKPTPKRPRAAFSPESATLPVRAVFQYWQQVMDHQGAILDNKRSKAIAARLKEGHSVERLKQAIDGCKASAWHQGKNNRQTVYDDIELICRDAKHVEEFITRVSGKSTQQQELDAWINHDNFIEGECRHVQA